VLACAPQEEARARQLAEAEAAAAGLDLAQGHGQEPTDGVGDELGGEGVWQAQGLALEERDQEED
jgi:hypothetical protein